MEFSIDFWIGVVCGAIGVTVLTAVVNGIHDWRARRAIRYQDRDTGGTSGWDLRG